MQERGGGGYQSNAIYLSGDQQAGIAIHLHHNFTAAIAFMEKK